MSRKPAEFVGLRSRKGKIARGYDADLVVWNPEEKFFIGKDKIRTPGVGRELFGKVEKTFLKGKKIFENGEVVGEPIGKVLLKKSLATC
jgi:allantoinase